MDYINLFIIILLIIFTVFLAVSAKKRKKKSSIAFGMLIAVMLLCLNIHDYLNDRINRSLLITSEYSGSIVLDVENYTKRFAYLDDNYYFASFKEINEIYDIAHKEYKDSSIKDNEITIFRDNCYYKINYDKERPLTKRYYAEAEEVKVYSGTRNSYFYLRFPKDMITKKDCTGCVFPVKCSFNELKEYYSNFKYTEFSDNIIEIRGENFKNYYIKYDNGNVTISMKERN